jgi:phytoene desaturase
MAGKAIVLGAGFSGMSAAAHMARLGFRVEVIEKHITPGGRARKFESGGFIFDMGPSFYLRPDIFESFYNRFDHKTSDFYNLVQPEKAFRVFFGSDKIIDFSSEIDALSDLLEQFEKGSSYPLNKIAHQNKLDHQKHLNKISNKTNISGFNYLFKKVYQKISVINSKTFTNSQISDLVNIPKIITGNFSTPKNDFIHFLFHAINGTLYPSGGFHKVAEAMEKICIGSGVEFSYNVNVDQLDIVKNRVMAAHSGHRNFYAETFVSSADYHFTDQKLIPETFRNYSLKYWDSKSLSPSMLIYFIGVNKKIEKLCHHNIFIDEGIKKHVQNIWKNRRWPESPAFYVQARSVADSSAAPAGCENLKIVIPVAPSLEDQGKVRDHYFNTVISRLEKELQTSILDHIIFHKSYAQSNFRNDYNAFKGNAYGIIKPYRQMDAYRPKIRNKHLSNLYYTGHMTVPGPGIHNSIISGEIVANQVFRDAGGHRS